MTEKTYFNLASSHPTWMITFPKSLFKDVQDVSHLTWETVCFHRSSSDMVVRTVPALRGQSEEEAQEEGFACIPYTSCIMGSGIMKR